MSIARALVENSDGTAEEDYVTAPCRIPYVTQNNDGSCWADTFVFSIMYPVSVRNIIMQLFKDPESIQENLLNKAGDFYDHLHRIKNNFDTKTKLTLRADVNIKQIEVSKNLNFLMFHTEKYINDLPQFSKEISEYMSHLEVLYQTDIAQMNSCPLIKPGRRIFELMYACVNGFEVSTHGGGWYFDIAQLFCKMFPKSFKIIPQRWAFGNSKLDRVIMKKSRQAPKIIFVENQNHAETPQSLGVEENINPRFIEYGSNIYYLKSAIISQQGHAMAISSCNEFAITPPDSKWLFFDGQSGEFFAEGHFDNFAKTFFQNPNAEASTEHMFELTYKNNDLNVFKNTSLMIYILND